jgi:hypothetical protein
MGEQRFSLPVRVMAMEIVLADILATVHQSTADPVLSLNAKRQKFSWFLKGNRSAIQDVLRDRFYVEEIELAVDGLFDMSQALLERKDLR